jgi:hypothetical protein
LNTIAPECSTTDSGVIRHALAMVVAYMARMKCVCWIPFGNPGRSRRVHQGQQIARLDARQRFRIARVGMEQSECAVSGCLVVDCGIDQHPFARKAGRRVASGLLRPSRVDRSMRR